MGSRQYKISRWERVEMIKIIELTEQQRQNLIALLDRVQVKGISECTEYLTLIKEIQNAKDKED